MDTMKQLSDQDLIELIRDRLDAHRRSRNDLLAVTEKLESMNRKLRESEALKTHFLSNIRNEINNPLTAIMGLAKQFAAVAGSPELSASIGGMIHFEAFNLDFQLRNIFAAAEMEAGEAVPVMVQSDIAGLVRDLVDSVSHLAARKQLRMTVSCPERLNFVTDPQMLHLILLNLLMNAQEFSGDGGEVRVTAAVEEGYLTLAVQDFGVGIAEGSEEEVFDRFRQLDTGVCKSHPGHGLGLSVVKALVELLGGTMALESRPGQGCCFTLVLPEGSLQSDMLAREGNFFLFDAPETF